MQPETLPLAEKGVFKPAPRLKGPAQTASEAVQSWPGIIAATHWHIYDSTRVDGADFYFGADELGHIHLDGEIHLATDSVLRKALIGAGLAERFPWYKSWVQFQIADADDAEHAAWLFRLNYDRLAGVSAQTLLERISARAGKEVTAG